MYLQRHSPNMATEVDPAMTRHGANRLEYPFDSVVLTSPYF